MDIVDGKEDTIEVEGFFTNMAGVLDIDDGIGVDEGMGVDEDENTLGLGVLPVRIEYSGSPCARPKNIFRRSSSVPATNGDGREEEAGLLEKETSRSDSDPWDGGETNNWDSLLATVCSALTLTVLEICSIG